jgi:O-antigen/teichoic acid export membrane protein
MSSRSLLKTSVGGMLWLLMQTGGMRIFGFLAQMVLARLLRPSDFGVIAVANSVSTIVSIAVGFGIDDVLLSRPKKLQMWAGSAFSASLTLGAAGGLALLAAAPLVARAYHDRAIVPLLAVSALGLPILSLSTVPYAALRSNLQFRFLAIYGTAEFAATQIMTVLFATAGLGALSFVVPIPIASAAKAFVLWRKAGVPKRDELRPRRFQLRALLRSGALVFGQKIIIALRNNGDYIVLGLFATKASVGEYYLAFRLAALPVYLFANSLTAVLYPTLSRLNEEPGRKKAAVIASSKAIGMTVIPICFFQAALSEPIVRLFFGSQWLAAAPLLTILSAGLAFDVVPCVACAEMSARGRFRQLWYWALISLPFFFLFVIAGCRIASAMGVAAGVAIYFVCMAPLYSYYSLREIGGTLRDVIDIYMPPIISAGIVSVVGYLLSTTAQPTYALQTAVLVALVSPVAYASIVWLISPEATVDLVRRLFGLMQRTSQANSY